MAEPTQGDAVRLSKLSGQREIAGTIAEVGKGRIALVFETKREDHGALDDFLVRYAWDDRAQAWIGADDPPPPASPNPDQPIFDAANEIRARLSALEADVAALKDAAPSAVVRG